MEASVQNGSKFVVSPQCERNTMQICRGCNLNVIKFIEMSKDTEKIKEFLVTHGLIAPKITCPTCNRTVPLNWKRRSFRCQRTYAIDTFDNENRVKKKFQCSWYRSCFKGTFFERVKIPTDKALIIIAYWLALPPPRHTFLVKELTLSEETIISWLRFCRYVIISWVKKSAKNKLGGEGEVIEIDETKMNGRKYHRGRYVEIHWVFGGVLRSNPKKVFVEPVTDRSFKTLMPIIQKWILPGTTIISDKWKAYYRLTSEGFFHETVNHRYNFINPWSGAHTQNVERMWRDMKSTVPRYGRKKNQLVGYLSEFIFKRAYPDLTDRIHQFFLETAIMFPAKEFVYAQPDYKYIGSYDESSHNGEKNSKIKFKTDDEIMRNNQYYQLEGHSGENLHKTPETFLKTDDKKVKNNNFYASFYAEVTYDESQFDDEKENFKIEFEGNGEISRNKNYQFTQLDEHSSEFPHETPDISPKTGDKEIKHDRNDESYCAELS